LVSGRSSALSGIAVRDGKSDLIYSFRLRLTICATAGSFWLKEWADKNTETGRNPDVGKYIGIYFAFGIGAAGLTAVQTLILWIFCSIEVSKRSVGNQ
jgi:hypothetical protein